MSRTKAAFTIQVAPSNGTAPAGAKENILPPSGGSWTRQKDDSLLLMSGTAPFDPFPADDAKAAREAASNPAQAALGGTLMNVPTQVRQGGRYVIDPETGKEVKVEEAPAEDMAAEDTAGKDAGRKTKVK